MFALTDFPNKITKLSHNYCLSFTKVVYIISVDGRENSSATERGYIVRPVQAGKDIRGNLKCALILLHTHSIMSFQYFSLHN